MVLLNYSVISSAVMREYASGTRNGSGGFSIILAYDRCSYVSSQIVVNYSRIDWVLMDVTEQDTILLCGHVCTVSSDVFFDDYVLSVYHSYTERIWFPHRAIVPTDILGNQSSIAGSADAAAQVIRAIIPYHHNSLRFVRSARSRPTNASSRSEGDVYAD